MYLLKLRYNPDGWQTASDDGSTTATRCDARNKPRGKSPGNASAGKLSRRSSCDWWGHRTVVAWPRSPSRVMKRVVIIASDFVPSSLPPATRVRFFVKHLREFGWEPVVLTVHPKHYEQAVDPENQNLLDPNLEVVHTGAFSVDWTRKIGVGDIGMRSLWQHWRELKRIHQRRPIDLIFIPVPPYVPMVLGRLAWMRLGIPYVIDFIDPWVTDYYRQLPKSVL